MDHLLIGNHHDLEKIRELVTLVSDTAFNVLLLGETGTGKEVVARLLHNSSSRKNEKFVKVNCAALPLTLLESELFGYEKGAFTGADKSKPGKFEQAMNGTILLDEIGDMPLILQAKLLQVLQDGVFNRLGSTRDVKVNTWVIASTNHNLEQDMKKGLFREDLFYRLNVIKVELPPLRDRKEDLSLLIGHFIEKHQRNLQFEMNLNIESELKDFLDEYHWPGNVRELSNIILRRMIGETPDIIKQELIDNMSKDGFSLSANEEFPISESVEICVNESLTGNSQKDLTLKDLKSEATKYIEKAAIYHAFEKTGGNKRNAAKLLQISYKALFNKLNNF